MSLDYGPLNTIQINPPYFIIFLMHSYIWTFMSEMWVVNQTLYLIKCLLFSKPCILILAQCMRSLKFWYITLSYSDAAIDDPETDDKHGITKPQKSGKLLSRMRNSGIDGSPVGLKWFQRSPPAQKPSLWWDVQDQLQMSVF